MEPEPIPLTALLVEDDPPDALLVVHELERAGYAPSWECVSTAADLLRVLPERRWDVVISDYSMPGFDAFEALRIVQAHDPDLPFLIVSGSIDEETAVSCMRAGAHDFLTKGRLARLAPVVARELRESELRREGRKAEAALRESQEQFRQAQKMEAIGRLAGGIAHDFNNLLTAIIGYSELLMAELPEEHPQRLDAREIRNAGERAARLTRQLLVFSRQQVVETELIDLTQVLQGMDHLLRRVIGEDIEVTAVAEPGLWTIDADAGQIEQVIMNLSVNARDAMPEGGRLLLEMANVELDGSYARHHLSVEPGQYVMLAVSDTGTGMSREVQSRLFEPFFTTKDRGKGTGLGLSTVYGIVQRSGGTIWVYSEEGKGTTFKVYLPRAETQDTVRPHAAADVDLSSPHGTRLLVVEDDEEVRPVIRRMLERYGYSVVDVGRGSAALAAAADHSFDLLITDLVLPDTNGRELADRLVSEGRLRCVLYLSGYTDRAFQVRERLEPGRAFFQKPFTPEALARKVRDVMAADVAGPGEEPRS